MPQHKQVVTFADSNETIINRNIFIEKLQKDIDSLMEQKKKLKADETLKEDLSKEIKELKREKEKEKNELSKLKTINSEYVEKGFKITEKCEDLKRHFSLEKNKFEKVKKAKIKEDKRLYNKIELKRTELDNVKVYIKEQKDILKRETEKSLKLAQDNRKMSSTIIDTINRSSDVKMQNKKLMDENDKLTKELEEKNMKFSKLHEKISNVEEVINKRQEEYINFRRTKESQIQKREKKINEKEKSVYKMSEDQAEREKVLTIWENKLKNQELKLMHRSPQDFLTK